MADIEINDLHTAGVNRDIAPHMLPPEALSVGNNVRAFNEAIERLPGWEQVFGSGALSVAPLHLSYVSSPSQPWWLWASAGKIFVWDGASNTDITRTVGGAYNATSASDWNSTAINGIPILNNGIDDPQYWATYSTGTNMQLLANWPANTKAAVVRNFLTYLIALNVTQAGTNHPSRVKWSASADPGTLPSWDETDPALDAGENDLSDPSSGQILDGLPLLQQFFIYKENSTWRFSLVGGIFIFDEKAMLEQSGILSKRCVCYAGMGPQAEGTKHFVVTQNDIIVHEGTANSAVSLLGDRFKRYLFNQIDTTNYGQSYVFPNPQYFEVWFCYPAVGSTTANRALIWNYKYNVFTEADIDFVHAATGAIQSSTLTWAAQTLTWAEDTAPWAQQDRRRVIVANQGTKKIHKIDSGNLRDGVAYTGTIQRTGLALIGKKRNGEPIVDVKKKKMIRRVWPKVLGGAVNVRVAYRDLQDGTDTWSANNSFNPNSDTYCDDVVGSGRFVGVEMSGTTNFRISGYKLDMAVLGEN